MGRSSLRAVVWMVFVGCAAPSEHDPERLTGTIAQHLLPCVSAQGYSAGVPRTICVATVDGKPVEVHTADAYLAMQSAARAAGVSLRIVSGFRTMAEQQYLYNLYLSGRGNLAARPGYSNHQSGLALDLNTSSASNIYPWLVANADRFGFIRTVPSENWHWEYRGRRTCTPGCESNTVLIDSNCGRGDCSVFGARCVNDAMGARCVFAACPATGTASICLSDRLVSTCTNGAPSAPGDCGAFAAFCSTAGRTPTQARCVSAFCVANNREVPQEHTGCWIEGGRLLRCDANGGATAVDCPAGQACSMLSGTARCAPRVCPATGTSKICVEDRYIADCIGGSVVSSGDCGAFAHYCSTAGGTAPRCVSVFCVANARETPRAHGVCLPDGRRGDCTATGNLQNLTACPAGQRCVVEGTTARCAVASTDAGVGPTDAGVVPTDAPAELEAGTLPDGAVIELPPPEEEPTEDPDAGASDVQSVETGTVSDASRDSAQEVSVSSDGGITPPTTGGCGCRIERKSSNASFAVLGLMALLAAMRRRRNRSVD